MGNPRFQCSTGSDFRFSSVSCRFAKNLSPDKINLSTLKGEGQLTNLELDEEVLQSLLDLPTWLAINRVCCNKAAIRVSDTVCAATVHGAEVLSGGLSNLFAPYF